MEDKIRTIVTEYLIPIIARDGGVLELVEVNGMQVRVRLSGACRGCPGKPLTLEHVILPTLRDCVDGNITVEAVA